MPPARPPRSLILVATVIAVLAEIGLGWLGQLPAWLLYPVALATGGTVIWIVLAIDMLARHNSRPDRKDIATLRTLHRSNDRRLKHHGQRLAHAEAHLRLLGVDRHLADAEQTLQQASARVETWESPTEDVPAWQDAVTRWTSIIEALDATLAPDVAPATDQEVRSARAQLPAAANFSSADLKAAVAYLVQRDRVIAAHDRLRTYRSAFERTSATTS